ncbi:EamA family transporter [Paraflavitalea soli]|uniref:EamA family transporter n=1 Tax=Paraflavitalea soli TaxID=2315862 RepID=A0A3B7MXH0_9BACT|nr:EamA family transporter [Paraflavitalea soli]AXY78193.1 EamA family transporter [Paraflavitalea soli]
MKRTQWTVILAFAAIYIIWGSTYLAIQVAIKDIPPFLMSALRFLTAGLLLVGWCVWKKQPMPDSKVIGKNMLYGILMLFGGTVSVTWAEQYLPSSLAAIIVSSLPFWFVLLDRKQWGYYFSNKRIIVGLLIGFAGVAILFGFGPSAAVSGGTGKYLASILVIIAGGIGWTIGSLCSKYRPAGNSLLVNAGIQLLAAGVFTGIVSLMAGDHHSIVWKEVSVNSWLALIYLIVMGSIVAYQSYLFLLTIRPAAQVSTYEYVNPVVALLLGAWIASEPVSHIQVIALVVILSGVLLVNMPQQAATSDKKVKQSKSTLI